MSKLDVYLRSIERFGAVGAILNSGQAVTLRFPTGDRHATQVTPHDQLVALVREVAPASALDLVDKQRPARFEIDSAGTRYAIAVAPKPGAWQVAIEPAEPAAAPVAPPVPARLTRSQVMAPLVEPTELAIERGQYDEPGLAPTTSGSLFLDQLTAAARGAHATDVYLGSGIAAFQRAGGALMQVGSGGALDGEALGRELGNVAPADARAAWTAGRPAVFAYGDGLGRVRVTLTRDQRGPGVALRLLPATGPELDQLGLPAEVGDWLGGRGLIVVAGPSGAGKTTALAALVHALGLHQRRVVTIEDPIELVHDSAWISQRAVGEHVPSIAAGVATAMTEAADAIVVGAVATGEAAAAVLEAVGAGHLVLTTLLGRGATAAVDRMVDRLADEHRELARGVVAESLIGTITAIVARDGGRTYEVTSGR